MGSPVVARTAASRFALRASDPSTGSLCAGIASAVTLQVRASASAKRATSRVSPRLTCVMKCHVFSFLSPSRLNSLIVSLSIMQNRAL